MKQHTGGDILAAPRIRLFFAAFMVSSVGTFAQYAAFVYVLATSVPLREAAELIAFVAMARALPTMLLTPAVGGVLDACPDRVVMILSNGLFIAQSLLLTIGSLHGKPSLVLLTTAWVMGGIAATFEGPSRSAWLRKCVGSDVYPRALRMQGLASGIPSMVAPLLGGLIIVRFGATPAFFLNAVLTCFLILAVWFAPAGNEQMPSTERESRGAAGFLRYVRKTPRLRAAALAQVAIAATLTAATFLTSAMVLERVPQGKLAIAVLVALQGLATVIAFSLTPRLAKYGFRSVFSAMLLGGAALFALGLTQQFVAFYIFATLVSLAIVAGSATANVVMQDGTNPNYRARISYINVFASLGMAPAIALLIGHVGRFVSLDRAVWIDAAICILLAFGCAALWRHDSAQSETHRPSHDEGRCAGVSAAA